MRRRMICLILCAVLLGSVLPTGAQAAGKATMSPVQAYVQGNTLRVFAHAEEDLAPDVGVDLIMNSNKLGDEQKLEPLEQSETPVHYVLLFDAKNYTGDFSWKRFQFYAQEILNEAQKPVQVSLIYMDKDGQIAVLHPEKAHEVKKMVNQIEREFGDFSRREVWEAGLAYCSDYERENGELMHLVLLTPEDILNEANLEEDIDWIRAVAQNSKTLTVNLVELKAAETAPTSLSDMKPGTHHVVGYAGHTTDAAEDLVESTEDLYWVTFPVNVAEDVEEVDVQLMLTLPDGGMEIVTVGKVGKLGAAIDMEPPAATDAAPIVALPEGGEIAPETEATEPESTEPAEGETAATEGAEGTESTDPTDATGATDGTEGTGSTEETLPAETGEAAAQEEGKGLPLAAIIGIGVGAAVLIAVILVLVLKGKKKPVVQGIGVPMRLKVISGKCKTPGDRFYLVEQLVLGSDKSCDIVFADKSVSPRNCRIFVRDGLIWIEDLNDKTNTTLEGMKIYAPNRLVTGNEITMGDVKIKFLF